MVLLTSEASDDPPSPDKAGEDHHKDKPDTPGDDKRLLVRAESCRAFEGSSFVEVGEIHQGEVVKSVKEDGDPEGAVGREERAFFGKAFGAVLEEVFADVVAHDRAEAGVHRDGGEGAKDRDRPTALSDVEDVFEGGKAEGSDSTVHNAIHRFIEGRIGDRVLLEDAEFEKLFDQSGRDKGREDTRSQGTSGEERREVQGGDRQEENPNDTQDTTEEGAPEDVVRFGVKVAFVEEVHEQESREESRRDREKQRHDRSFLKGERCEGEERG